MPEITPQNSQDIISSGAALWGALLAIWSGALSVGGVVLARLVGKRDDKLDEHDRAIVAQTAQTNELTLALERNKTFNAETYATRPTMIAMFQSATEQTKEAVARVEKRQDETNSVITEQGRKLDGVKDSISLFQKEVMQELVKKT